MSLKPGLLAWPSRDRHLHRPLEQRGAPLPGGDGTCGAPRLTYRHVQHDDHQRHLRGCPLGRVPGAPGGRLAHGHPAAGRARAGDPGRHALPAQVAPLARAAGEGAGGEGDLEEAQGTRGGRAGE